MSKFSTLLSPDAVCVDASPAMWDKGLMGEESAAVLRAVEKRRREFTAGRNCARQAILSLTGDVHAIPVGPNREPIFPTSLSGTITHSENFCSAAVIKKGVVESIGIDVTPNEPLADDLLSLIMTEKELRSIQALTKSHVNWGRVVFSAKEAFYKALYQVRPQFVDFLEVEVELYPENRKFLIRATDDVFQMRGAPKAVCCYAYDLDYVYTGVTLFATSPNKASADIFRPRE